MLTEGEQGDFDTFALAWLSVFLQKGRKGKTPLWKVSQENPNFYSKAQQAHQQATPTFTNQCLAYKISGSAPSYSDSSSWSGSSSRSAAPTSSSSATSASSSVTSGSGSVWIVSTGFIQAVLSLFCATVQQKLLHTYI